MEEDRDEKAEGGGAVDGRVRKRGKRDVKRTFFKKVSFEQLMYTIFLAGNFLLILAAKFAKWRLIQAHI